MKKLFKILALVAVIFAGVGLAKAERVPCPVEKMPAQVQRFLNDYYPGAAVESSWAKMMHPTTEPMWWRVNLKDGTKMQFTLDGTCSNISAKKSKTPIPVILLPNEARKYLADNYPNQTIVKYKFKKDQYKITLSNGDKLVFDKDYQLAKVKKAKDKKK